MRRARMVAAALVVAAFFAPRIVRADPTGPQVVIDVHDAVTHTPLVANVVLFGPTTLSDFADKTGKVVFKDLAPGVYTARVSRPGYATVISERFEVREGTSLHVELTKTPKVIGTVAVAHRPSENPSEIDDRSPLRQLSTNVVDALGMIPGVTVSSDDPNGGTLNVSLDGRPASETGLEIEGIPLNAPGVAGNLRALSADLFSSASVSFTASPSAPAGTVGFRTLEPTLDWRVGLTSNAGINSAFSQVASVQGSIGDVGVALEHATNRAPSADDGKTYIDASGFDYPHFGVGRTNGDVFKLRAHVGSQSLLAFALDSTNVTDAVCPRDTTLVPCGYGPGNVTGSGTSLVALTDSFPIGSAAVQVAAYTTTSSSAIDFSNRYIDAIAYPSTQSSASVSTGEDVRVQFARSGNNAPSFDFSRSRTIASGSSASSVGLQSFGFRSSTQSAVVGDELRASRLVTVQPHAGYATFGNGTPGSFLAGINITLSQPHMLSALALDIGALPTPEGGAVPLSAPDQLLSNCASGTAQGTAPGDAAGTAHQASARLSSVWSSSRVQASAQAYLTVENDASLGVLVPATGLGSEVTPGYLAAAAAAFTAPTACGAGAVLAPQNVYLQSIVHGINLVYRGIHASIKAPIGSQLSSFANLDLRSARAYGTDPRLSLPTSPFISGSELHGVAPFRGTLGVVIGTPQAQQFLASAQWSGTNNPQNLPPFWTINAAVSSVAGRGSLKLLITNLFDTHAGFFVSPVGALGVPLVNGQILPGIAQPVAPRAVTLTYSMAVGRDARVTPTALAPEGSDQAAPSSPYRIVAFPALPPADPFERNTAATCTRRLRAIADPIAATLRDAVAGRPSDAPAIPDTRITAVDEVSHSYLIATPRIDVAQAIMSCQVIHVGSIVDARRAHVYGSDAISYVEQQLYFAPRVGYYIVQPKLQSGFLQRFRTSPIPTSRPDHPFALVDSDRCVEPLRSLAKEMLAQLDGAFAHDPVRSAGDWTIERRRDGPSGLYVLSSNRTGTLLSMFSCAHVAGATPADLKARGIRGTYDDLFYTPELGLVMTTPGNAP